ncbi:hypothetical protein D9619_003540 [Psilocybe cf. subviscida]|uniref:F-box domain-containing protein n=1 Tax=Psilocybe cf. subviscida TaxID=2480587 RepID=A0A8H5AW38_9AGAR|nr:hypothetical protein D9619_003540 [Psilocybe cf. subviscida]
MPLPPSIDDAVQRVDAQISHYFDLIRDLRSQRNALVPISQFPTEVLCRIFMEVRGGCDSSRYTNHWFWTKTSYSEPSLEWIAVSHVSRHWREAAIREPRLWTDPPLNNSKWATIMLERSCMATLPAITMRFPKFGESALSALGPHLPRTSSLVIPAILPQALQKILSHSYLPLSAPELETLSVNCWTNSALSKRQKFWYHIPFKTHEEAVIFPDNVLHDTPKLKRLELRGIVINWRSTLLSHLTTLAISNIPDHSKPTPTQLITMLESAPGLTRLYLGDVCPSIESNSSDNLPRRFPMHSLAYVNLRGHIHQLLLFFRIVAAPGLQGCSITVTYSENVVVHLPQLFLSMSQSFNISNVIGSDKDVRRLQLAHCTQSDLYVRASKVLPCDRSLEPDKGRPDTNHLKWIGLWDKIDHRCLIIEIAAHLVQSWNDNLEWDSARLANMQQLTSAVISHLFRSFDWNGLSELDTWSLKYGQQRMFASTFGTIPDLRESLSGRWDI